MRIHFIRANLFIPLNDQSGGAEIYVAAASEGAL
jgi:hypothetical protein